jgi:hypothetical protein
MFKTQKIDISETCITFDNLIQKTPFAPLMKKILEKLQDAYGQPVDVEFAWDNGKLYLLQCRSLSIGIEEGKITIPQDVPEEQILFTNHQVVTACALRDIEMIVYVDPRAYARLSSHEEKLAIGRVVSHLNRILEGKRYALLGPGRWGSNNINLGVRVAYEDINRTLVLGEIAFEEGGSTPDVSYGTHFFNDLVEAHIVPVAIFPDQEGTVFKEDFFLKAPNLLVSLAPEYASHESVVHVIHVPKTFNGRFLQIYQDSRAQQSIGFLDARALNHTPN